MGELWEEMVNQYQHHLFEPKADDNLKMEPD